MTLEHIAQKSLNTFMIFLWLWLSHLPHLEASTVPWGKPGRLTSWTRVMKRLYASCLHSPPVGFSPYSLLAGQGAQGAAPRGSSHPNCFCSTMHHRLICIISLFIFAVRALSPTGSRVSRSGVGVRLRAVLTVPVLRDPGDRCPMLRLREAPWVAEELWTGLKFSSHFICGEKGGSFP